jgi:ornithine cyclodeaminase/alanine dehydrogenase-like protein (mu-crystallin family)
VSTLILTRRDVAALLDLRACIAAVEEAFRQHALGTAVPPGVMAVQATDGGFHVKAAGIRQPRPLFAAKVNANFRHNRERHGLPTIQGVIVLADLDDGRLLALLDSTEITLQRTAAATAVAADRLARQGASIVTVVGCGGQGRAQLRALACVRPIAAVHAFDIDERACRRFAGEMAPEIGAPVRVAGDVHAALRQADVVVTCTTSHEPIVRPGDLRPGTFLAAVGADAPDKQEVDVGVMATATVVADVLAQSLTIGDAHHAVAAGLLTPGDVYAELGEIVCERKAGRRSDDEIIVFDSTGMAVQDVATSALVYQRALDAGVGLPVTFA